MSLRKKHWLIGTGTHCRQLPGYDAPEQLAQVAQHRTLRLGITALIDNILFREDGGVSNDTVLEYFKYWAEYCLFVKYKYEESQVVYTSEVRCSWLTASLKAC